MFRPWGLHSAFNVYKACPTSIRCAKNIYQFNKELVTKIDMKAWGEPQIVHFGSGNKAGYSLVQLIETSNICAHFVEEDNSLFLDVFSCKEFKESDVKAVLYKYFKPENIHSTTFERIALPASELK
jgi:S-adenosylmethionine decarboxylase